MSSHLYEIVELSDGVYGLQRSDSEDEPVVTIRFSPQSLAFLEGAQVDVVKAMIEAGIRQVEEFTVENENSESSSKQDQSVTNKVIH